MKVTDLSNIKEHPFYLLGDRVAEICAPLFNNFPINSFAYWRKYHENNTVISLLGNKDWICQRLQEGHPFVYTGQKIWSWASLMSPKEMTEVGVTFNCWNGIAMEKTYQNYVEILGFTSPNQNNTPLEFCCNQELLNQFLLYFKNKTNSIIKILEKEPLYFPEDKFIKIEALSRMYDYDSSHTNFHKMTNTKKVRFNLKSKEVFFSRREFDVLSLLAKGKSMAEAAEILQISRRTVETYLYKAKNKADMFTVSNLLDNFTESLF